jgi:hypothetical protein
VNVRKAISTGFANMACSLSSPCRTGEDSRGIADKYFIVCDQKKATVDDLKRLCLSWFNVSCDAKLKNELVDIMMLGIERYDYPCL